MEQVKGRTTRPTRRLMFSILLSPRPRKITPRLVVLMNEFCAAWNDLARELNEGRYDIKRAKTVNAKYKNLLNSGEWPK